MYGIILLFIKFNNFGTRRLMGQGVYFIHSAALPGVYLSPCVYMSPALKQINTVHTQTHTHPQVHTQTRAHAHTHTHTHKHTQTHTNTHIMHLLTFLCIHELL